MILVTGGCGFIGSNFVSDWLNAENEAIVVIDKLTYAGTSSFSKPTLLNPNHVFIQEDINSKAAIEAVFKQYKPRAVINFAAETHVDKSIHNPGAFIQSNINGTFCLLECAKHYWQALSATDKSSFRYLQISTDEVYGSLEMNDPAFTENSQYRPNSPYSASKAASDHLVHAYHHTYGLPTLLTRCSNNYGPHQYPEKLIPLTIINALQNRSIPIYGDGLNVRDWIYVMDHVKAIKTVLKNAAPGSHYNVGGCNEITNIQLVTEICELLDSVKPNPTGASYKQQITFVKDRPGHDKRYAIDNSKIERELNWAPVTQFTEGLKSTIDWYMDHYGWITQIQNNGNYQQWIQQQYLQEQST